MVDTIKNNIKLSWCLITSYKSIFRIEIPEPYHEQMEGRKIGTLELLPVQTIT